MIPLGILASSVRRASAALLAPTDVTSTLLDNQVLLTWTDRNTNETGHRIYRSSSPMDTQALPPPEAELGPNVTEWEDTDTPVDQEVYYIVSAVRGVDEAFSDEVMVDLRETTYEVFTSSGNYLVPDGVTEVDVLIVAGGGGGGSRQGGGGGAGGLRVVRTQVVPGETVPVVVGSGGLGGTNGGRGENGQDSSFGSLSALGGGGGGGRTSDNRGADGGSGGGGAHLYSAGAGAGATGQGKSGGHASDGSLISVNVGGGGGGASLQGADGTGAEASGVGGDGGDGYLFPDLSGLGLGDEGWFSGGGGGGVWETAAIPGQGGLGGGGSGVGSGVSAPAPGFPGKTNTGGGGGGSNATNTAGGIGGSGIVVVCYPVGGLNPTLPESAISALRALTVTL